MVECDEVLQELRKLRNQYQPVYQIPETVTEERYAEYIDTSQKIADWIGDVSGKKILDIGSFYGFYCFKLAEMGAKTTGVEFKEERVDICNCLKERKANPKFAFSEIGDYLEAHPRTKYDYVLLLKVFMHIEARQRERGWWILNNLAKRSKALFLQMGLTRRPWDGKGSRHYCATQEGIPAVILKNSDYTDYKLLQTYHGKIPHLYVFWTE